MKVNLSVETVDGLTRLIRLMWMGLDIAFEMEGLSSDLI